MVGTVEEQELKLPQVPALQHQAKPQPGRNTRLGHLEIRLAAVILRGLLEAALRQREADRSHPVDTRDSTFIMLADTTPASPWAWL